MLAHHVSRRLARGEVSLPVLESALQTLSVQGFLARSRRLSRYLGESDPRRNTDTRSDTARTSSILCAIKTMIFPSSSGSTWQA